MSGLGSPVLEGLSMIERSAYKKEDELGRHLMMRMEERACDEASHEYLASLNCKGGLENEFELQGILTPLGFNDIYEKRLESLGSSSMVLRNESEMSNLGISTRDLIGCLEDRDRLATTKNKPAPLESGNQENESIGLLKMYNRVKLQQEQNNKEEPLEVQAASHEREPYSDQNKERVSSLLLELDSDSSLLGDGSPIDSHAPEIDSRRYICSRYSIISKKAEQRKSRSSGGEWKGSSGRGKKESKRDVRKRELKTVDEISTVAKASILPLQSKKLDATLLDKGTISSSLVSFSLDSRESDEILDLRRGSWEGSLKEKKRWVHPERRSAPLYLSTKGLPENFTFKAHADSKDIGRNIQFPDDNDSTLEKDFCAKVDFSRSNRGPNRKLLLFSGPEAPRCIPSKAFSLPQPSGDDVTQPSFPRAKTLSFPKDVVHPVLVDSDLAESWVSFAKCKSYSRFRRNKPSFLNILKDVQYIRNSQLCFLCQDYNSSWPSLDLGLKDVLNKSFLHPLHGKVKYRRATKSLPKPSEIMKILENLEYYDGFAEDFRLTLEQQKKHFFQWAWPEFDPEFFDVSSIQAPKIIEKVEFFEVALASLCVLVLRDPVNSKRLMEETNFKLLEKLSASNVHSPPLLCWVCAIVGALSIGPNDSLIRLLPFIIRSVLDLPGDEGVQAVACLLILRLACFSENVNSLLASGSLHILKSALDRFPSNQLLQTTALQGLAALSVLGNAKIGADTTLPWIMPHILEDPEKEDLEGGKENMYNLRKYQRQVSSLAIASILVGVEGCQPSLFVQLVQGVLRMLKVHVSDPMIQGRGWGLLSRLAAKRSELTKLQLEKCKGVALARMAINRNPMEVAVYVRRLLDSLECT